MFTDIMLFCYLITELWQKTADNRLMELWPSLTGAPSWLEQCWTVTNRLLSSDLCWGWFSPQRAAAVCLNTEQQSVYWWKGQRPLQDPLCSSTAVTFDLHDTCRLGLTEPTAARLVASSCTNFYKAVCCFDQTPTPPPPLWEVSWRHQHITTIHLNMQVKSADQSRLMETQVTYSVGGQSHKVFGDGRFLWQRRENMMETWWDICLMDAVKHLIANTYKYYNNNIFRCFHAG